MTNAETLSRAARDFLSGDRSSADLTVLEDLMIEIGEMSDDEELIDLTIKGDSIVLNVSGRRMTIQAAK